MIVISDDASAFDGLEIYDPSKVTERVESFEDPESMLNANGYVEIPITDPEHLKEIRLTADVTSSAGSSWAYAGCAVCINAKDAAGNKFWTSKGSTSVTISSSRMSALSPDTAYTAAASYCLSE